MLRVLHSLDVKLLTYDFPLLSHFHESTFNIIADF
jgi:hypothetical protein